MKTIKKLILLLSIFTGIIIVHSTSTMPRWISDPDNMTRFSETGTEEGVEYIKDSFTGLKWEKNVSNAQYLTNRSGFPTWNYYENTYVRYLEGNDAFKHCKEKGLGWRVPSIYELQTLISDKKMNLYGAYSTHPGITKGYYITSTRVTQEYSSYYNYTFGRVDFTNGTIGTTSHNSGNVICLYEYFK